MSPLDDPESNLRELKSALALITEVDWRTLDCKTCQDVRYITMVSTLWNENEFLLPTVPDTMWFASTKRLLHIVADDARDDHETKQSDTKILTTLCRWHRTLFWIW